MSSLFDWPPKPVTPMAQWQIEHAERMAKLEVELEALTAQVGATSTNYHSVLVLRMPAAWKQRAKVLVGFKVKPECHVRFARLYERSGIFARMGYSLTDGTALRLTKRQAVMAKLRLEGKGFALVSDPKGELWLEIVRAVAHDKYRGPGDAGYLMLLDHLYGWLNK